MLRRQSLHLLDTKEYLKSEEKYAVAWREACYHMVLECHDQCNLSAEALKGDGLVNTAEVSPVVPVKESMKAAIGQFAFVVIKVREKVELSLFAISSKLTLPQIH